MVVVPRSPARSAALDEPLRSRVGELGGRRHARACAKRRRLLVV